MTGSRFSLWWGSRIGAVGSTGLYLHFADNIPGGHRSSALRVADSFGSFICVRVKAVVPEDGERTHAGERNISRSGRASDRWHPLEA